MLTLYEADHRWLLWETESPTDTPHLSSIGCTLTVADIYEKVDFEERDSP